MVRITPGMFDPSISFNDPSYPSFLSHPSFPSDPSINGIPMATVIWAHRGLPCRPKRFAKASATKPPRMDPKVAITSAVDGLDQTIRCFVVEKNTLIWYGWKNVMKKNDGQIWYIMIYLHDMNIIYIYIYMIYIYMIYTYIYDIYIYIWYIYIYILYIYIWYDIYIWYIIYIYIWYIYICNIYDAPYTHLQCNYGVTTHQLF